MIVRTVLIAATSALALSACGREDPAGDLPAGTTTASSVERVSPQTPAPPAPAPVLAVIQTQPAADGVQVALNRVQVTGDVLTVQTTFTNPGESSAGLRFSVEEVSVIDDATAQRYGVLRDATGRWQASPLQSATSEFVSFGVTRGGGSEVVWFKFPAPPATSPTVSINLPGVGPFDGVPVTR